MSSSPPTEAPAVAFTCECGESARPACKDLPFFKEQGGKLYCVLHYPGGEKAVAFDEALRRKLDAEDFDFSEVVFPGTANFNRFAFTKPVNFNSAKFGADANFYHASFNATASFNNTVYAGRANFYSVTFNDGVTFDNSSFNSVATFYSTQFNSAASFKAAAFNSRSRFSSSTFHAAASFQSATFDERAYFSLTTFKAKANFAIAAFSAEAAFGGATFESDVSFSSTVFKDYVRFAGGSKRRAFNDCSNLEFLFARIENPDRLSFHTLTLCPRWFVNVDARKFEFINVDWKWRDTQQEIEDLKPKFPASAHRLLATTCRNLAINAEDNHRYEEASRFRYMAMDARRLERWRGFAVWRLDWWYWLASGYGERMLRALAVFFAIWLGFAVLYALPAPVRCPAEAPARADCLGWDTRNAAAGFLNGFFNSAVYAIETMTLQKPEPRPLSPLARLAVLLCTVLGPVQAALLALAIRRKFMR